MRAELGGESAVSEFWEDLWYPSQPEGWARRAALSPLNALSLLFRAGVACRNGLYAQGVHKPVRVEGARVISIGNLTVGGAGKTPAVIFLANFFAGLDRRVAVLSRGYGRKTRKPLLVSGNHTLPARIAGDEPLLISRRCPAAAVLVGADRVQLAERARREHAADIILLDDGMQYQRLQKDFEIAVIDEAVGFGNGKLLPRGPLREPASALARANLLWIRVQLETAPLHIGFPSVRVRHAPIAVLSPTAEEHSPDVIRGRRAFAFAAVARPRSFLRTLRGMSADVVGARFFSDHHLFTRAELDRILRAAEEHRADLLLTTEKDQVRLPAGFPAWTVRLGVEILEGGDSLFEKLRLL